MTAAEAASILQISPDAKPEQIEERFLELRAKLEDRLAKAPTPGLKDKYRRSLEELVTAFEHLMLSADGSSLPVLQRVAELKAETQAPFPVSSSAAAAAPQARRATGDAGTAAPPRRKSGSLEFVIVAVVAVLLLGAGGWWVMKVRAEKAEQARLEAEAQAEAQAEAERAAAAEQEDRERLEQLTAHIRVQLAEAGLMWEAVEREERDAERTLNNLRSELRSLRDPPPGKLNEMNARVSAQEEYVRWLRDVVLNHPSRRFRLRTEEFLSAGQIDASAAELSQLREAIDPLRTEMASARDRLLTIEGSVRITSSPDGVPWEFTDAFGRRRTGRTPATVSGVAEGSLRVIFKRPGWPEQRRNTAVPRGGEATARAEYAEGKVVLKSNMRNVEWEVIDALDRKQNGRGPGTASGVAAGRARVVFNLAGWNSVEREVSIPRDGEGLAEAEFIEGNIVIESTPAGAEVFRGRNRWGRTPHQTSAATGEYELEVRLPAYRPAKVSGLVKSRETARLKAELEPGRWTIPGVDLELVPIPAGTFVIGSESSAVDDEKPLTRVTLSHGFWMGKTEVTQRQWHGLMGTTVRQQRDKRRAGLSLNSEGDDYPMYYVSWEEAMEFCRRLTDREQEAGRLPPGHVYTLPTEAQWEYTCRAGTTADYAGDVEAMAWHKENSGGRNQRVARKRANAWGLHDMHGNVWEWCLDGTGSYPGGEVSDLYRPPLTGRRICRSGSRHETAWTARSSNRTSYNLDSRYANFGFRIALAPDFGILALTYVAVTPENAQELGVSRSDGWLVRSLAPDGPAGKVGIDRGDVIIAIDGGAPGDFNFLTNTAGAKATLRYVRDDEIREAEVVLGGRREQSRAARVTISTTPAGATISRGGVELGQTPSGELGSLPGRFTVLLERSGYVPQEVTIDLDYGSEEAIDVTLAAASSISYGVIGVAWKTKEKGSPAEIVRLIPGSPAARTGELRKRDRIIAIIDGNERIRRDILPMSQQQLINAFRGPIGRPIVILYRRGRSDTTHSLALIRTAVRN